MPYAKYNDVGFDIELDAYNKSLIEEREELADNYFKSQPLNPREPVFGVQCMKLVDCDEVRAELIIDGQKYYFNWETK